MTKSFHVGIAGAGLIARDHALCLSRLEQVAGIFFYDTQAERACALAHEFGGSAVASLDELVKVCDIVWVCTPPFARVEPIRAACRAGIAVFCEKPLAVNIQDAGEICEIVRQTGTPFFMGQSNRYLSVFRKMKQLAESGSIGRIVRLWSIRLGWLDALGAPPWRLDDERGGGVVVELGIHEIDFVRWLGGEWENVYARGSSAILVPGQFQDSLLAVGGLTGGVNASIELSWASPRYLWQRGVEGTKGSLFFDDSCIRQVQLLRPGREPEIHEVENWLNEETGENTSLVEQARDVLRKLATEDAPAVTLDDGLRNLKVALAMRQSAREGTICVPGQ